MSPPYYTVHFIFHSAQNLPVADLATFSCDPYVEATIVVPSYKDQSPREPADPPLQWRTPTARRTRNPTWDSHWLIAAVPADGFFLEMRVRDEDQKRDDRLGRAVVHFESAMMHEGFEVKEKAYKVKKRKGSLRPWLQTYLAAAMPGQKLQKHNRVVLSARIIGKSMNEEGRKPYTIGPNAYTEHFSPILGHFVHHGDKFIKSLPPESSPPTTATSSSSTDKKQKQKQRRISASSFAVVKLQLSGPAPPEFRCHYVGYNTFIKWLYSNSGIVGSLLNHGLRKQYRTIYSYDKNTKYGVIQHEGEHSGSCTDLDLHGGDNNSDAKTVPNVALARTFLSLTRFDAGASRLYTYVITLDAEWRFSETGDEFAIDFLSKHMMHADGAPVVMISGEFFVRKIAEFEKSESSTKQEGGEGGDEEKENAQASTGNGDAEHLHPPPVRSSQSQSKSTDQTTSASHNSEIDMDPSHYELIIDNNSGTYRPPVSLLPAFQAWLAAPHRLGALGRVTAMDAFDDNLKRMKEERKETKKRLAGGKLPKRVAVRRGSSVSGVEGEISSMSSGEVEDMLAEAEKKNDEQEQEHKRQQAGKGRDQKENEGTATRSANDAGTS